MTAILAQPAQPLKAQALRAPKNPRCEYQVNPVGIDVTAPRLSWEVNDRRRGAMQTAYQILVATDLADLKRNKGTAWDSGKVPSDQSVHVIYGGSSLQSGTRYYWKVRTWDKNDKPSPYSEPAYWEMGLLNPQDWQARWITLAEKRSAVKLGQWIWHPTAKGEGATAFFRKSLDLDPNARIAQATIRTTADNRLILYVNGRKIAEHSHWETIPEYEVASALQPGKNLIAIEGKNEGGPCGLLFGMLIRYEDGRSVELVSNDQWLASDRAEGNWTALDYDDSGWGKTAVIANYGDQPWGRAGESRPYRSQYLRKEFSLKGKVSRARAYVSGLGLYELWINGKPVSNDVFSPGWTHYDKRVQYQTYDVTRLLRPRENAVGAIIGNGWWSSGMGGHYSGSGIRFLLQINVEYANGSRETIGTDESWKASPSPILEDSLYHGETYDARLEIPDWSQPGLDDHEWSPVEVVEEVPFRLVAQYGPPIKVTEELRAVQITQPAQGVYVFDFGQNAAGRARLRVRGAPGTRVQIRFAEVLKPDGNIYTENYRSARATDVYILKGGGEEVWEPKFTYRGFRYAELRGYPGKPSKNTLVMRVLHSAPPFTGKFGCANDLINRIQHNITWGQRSNMHSVPTDCPQRDERLGWMGDAQIFAPTSCWNMEMAGFYTKWMRDILDSQGEDGHVTDIAPAVRGGPASPGWGDAVIIIPWTAYRFYGDKRLIEENYEGMVAWVEYMRRNAPNDLYEREGYGDWIAVVPSPSKPIGTAYYYYSTKLLSQMAAAIGREADASKYAELAERIAAAFNAAYLDKETNHYLGATQTANLLPLYFGITPLEKRQAVLQNLINDILARDYHLSTGFLGTAYLMPLLAQMQYTLSPPHQPTTAPPRHLTNSLQEIAYRLATQKTYPSWGYMVEKGATTIWELWNSDTEGPAMNSRNHFALGAVGQWFYEALAGINPDPAQPGFKHLIIRPQPAGNLKWAKAEYHSMYGLILSAWRIENGKFTLEIEIPANTTATVYVPTSDPSAVKESDKPANRAEGVQFLRMEGNAAVYRVDAGRYRFEGKE